MSDVDLDGGWWWWLQIVCAITIENIGRTQWQRRRLIKIELYKSICPLGLIPFFVHRKEKMKNEKININMRTV
jgi:hypothetical protein